MMDYNNMMPRVLVRGGGLLLAALLVVFVMAEEGGVGILNAETLQSALQQNQQVVLYFSQEDCKHCSEFAQIFALVEKLHSELAVFYKITFSAETGHLFESYSIDSTPTVLAFSDGEVLPFRYEPTGSGNALSVQFFKWVERLFQPLRQWQGDDSHSHQLIVHCHTQQFSDFWQEVSRVELWLDVYCGSEKLLKGSLAIVHEYGRQVEAWQLENDFQQVSAKLRRLIRAYKYKYVLAWSSTLAQEVFRSNVSVFVLIVNNETRSRELQGHYQEIKKKWYENSHNYEPTIFAVSDLSVHTFETIQLKRYLTGHATFDIKEYHYPIVGFIARGAQEGKYLLNLATDKNRTVLEEFITSVDQHIIRGEPYNDEETPLELWLREGGLPYKSASEEEAEKNEKKKEEVTKILTQQNWMEMLVSYDNPFFVYFTWRNNFRICQLEREFTDWWEGEDPDFAEHRHAYDIFLHMHHMTDLPVIPGLTLDYFPSLYYFSKEKEIVKLEGVTNLQKIKKFIKEALDRDTHRK